MAYNEKSPRRSRFENRSTKRMCGADEGCMSNPRTERGAEVVEFRDTNVAELSFVPFFNT